jgi:hypothetical protein
MDRAPYRHDKSGRPLTALGNDQRERGHGLGLCRSRRQDRSAKWLTGADIESKVPARQEDRPYPMAAARPSLLERFS